VYIVYLLRLSEIRPRVRNLLVIDRCIKWIITIRGWVVIKFLLGEIIIWGVIKLCIRLYGILRRVFFLLILRKVFFLLILRRAILLWLIYIVLLLSFLLFSLVGLLKFVYYL